MKKILLVLVLALTSANFCNSQEIEIQKNIMGMRFIQDGEKLSNRQVKDALISNREAYLLYKKSRSSATWGAIFGLGGGYMMGVPLGQSIANSADPNWTLGGIGIGVAIIGTIISMDGEKKAKKAIDMYNSSLNSTSHYQFKPEFQIISNQYGMGLSMNF